MTKWSRCNCARPRRDPAGPSQIGAGAENLCVHARGRHAHGGKLSPSRHPTSTLRRGICRATPRAVKPGPTSASAVSDHRAAHGTLRAQARLRARSSPPRRKAKETRPWALYRVWHRRAERAGTIWVYSEPGQGTTLKIYLPRGEIAAKMTGDCHQTRGKSRPRQPN